MASEWPNTTIGEHVDLITGEAFQSALFETAPSDGVRLARGDNVKEGGFEWGEKSRFWPELTPDLERYLLSEGDVLLGMDGSKVGKNWVRVRREDLPCLLVQRVARLRSKPTLHQRFLRYLIGNPMFRDYVGRVRTGTSIPHISGGQIKSYEFRLPPLADQRAIASVLGALDDKIDLNRRMCQTLEEMARALFKSWFVDFDPVRAKMEGRDPGLPKEIADLFPSRLIDSELGPIPEGWRVTTVAELCSSISSGGTPQRMTQQYWNGGKIPWFKTGELFDRPLIDSEEKVTELALANSACKLWPEGTILFALYASPTVGRMGVLTQPGTSNQAAAGLIVLPAIGVPFMLNALYFARAKLQQIAVGAAQQNINQGVLKGHRIVVPNSELAGYFSGMMKPALDRQASLDRQSDTLAALRDTLLPKLISGELRVPASLGSMQEVAP